MDAHAEGLIIKCLLYLLSIRRLIKSKSEWYSTIYGCDLNYLDDPTPIAAIARSLYESMLAFNHIYANSTNLEEKKLRYCFWRLDSAISKAQSEALTNIQDDAKFSLGKMRMK